jgi:hypothetical protein
MSQKHKRKKEGNLNKHKGLEEEQKRIINRKTKN